MATPFQKAPAVQPIAAMNVTRLHKVTARMEWRPTAIMQGTALEQLFVAQGDAVGGTGEGIEDASHIAPQVVPLRVGKIAIKP